MAKNTAIMQPNGVVPHPSVSVVQLPAAWQCCQHQPSGHSVLGLCSQDRRLSLARLHTPSLPCLHSVLCFAVQRPASRASVLWAALTLVVAVGAAAGCFVVSQRMAAHVDGMAQQQQHHQAAAEAGAAKAAAAHGLLRRLLSGDACSSANGHEHACSNAATEVASSGGGGSGGGGSTEGAHTAAQQDATAARDAEETDALLGTARRQERQGEEAGEQQHSEAGQVQRRTSRPNSATSNHQQ